MISIIILVHEFLLLIYLGFFKLNSDKLVNHIDTDFPDRLELSENSKKLRNTLQKIVFLSLLALFIFNLVMIIINQPYSVFFVFIIFIVLCFVYSLISPGKILNSIFISKNSDTFFDKDKKKLINTLIYFIFIISFSVFGTFTIISRNLNSYAKEISFSQSTNKEFLIDPETDIFVEDEYLYLYSDFASGINVYNLDGEYLHSYYFYGGSNGSSMIYFKDDYFFIRTKSGSALIRYKDGQYQGHLEVGYFDDYDIITVYDENGEVLISNLPLEDYWTIFAFDDEFIYYESDKGGGGFFKTNGTILEQWDKDVTSFINQNEDGVYSLTANQVYKQNDVIISSSEIHFVATNFFYVWLVFFMNFSILFSMTKLIYLNNLTDKNEVKPVTSKTKLDLIDRYKKSIRIDFIVSILFSITIFLLYNLFLTDEFSEIGLILLTVFFFLGIILNDLVFGLTSLGKRIFRLRTVDTESNKTPRVSSVIKRRWMEMFSAIEMNPELLESIDNKTRTKIIDVSNKSN